LHGGFERQKDHKCGAEAVVGIERRQSALQDELRLGYGAKRGCVIADRFADGV
jgi:hypothetical protein